MNNLNKIWFTYILECKDNSLYIGVTNDLNKRIKQHKGEIQGGAKYTKSKKVLDFVYIEPHISKSICFKREYSLKQCNKKQKIDLINSNKNFLNLLK